MIILLALLSTAVAEDKDNKTYVDFEAIEVDVTKAGPALKLVTVKPTAKPDLLIPDVRQLFIDKHPKPAK